MPLTPSLLAELVRLPALLSVPGDALVGSAAARTPRGSAVAPGSALLYAGGMALNDVADRLVDALERPGRPIPSGRVTAAEARRVATGLLAGGALVARVAGGRWAGRVAVPLVGAVVAYDTRAKQGDRGPAVMAACRGLDVLLGAAPGGPAGLARALPAAGVVATHTVTVTGVSLHEVDGASTPAGRTAVASARRRVRLTALAAVALSVPHGRAARRAAVVGAAAYVAQCEPALRRAAASGSAADTQRAVGACVLGVIPLQASLLASQGAPRRAALVLGLLLPARRAARRRSAT